MNQDNLQYLKQDQIGKVIAKGLACLYTQKPKAPIKYLANWLKNHSKNQKELSRLTGHASVKKTKLQVYSSNLQLQEQKKRDQEIQKHKSAAKIQQFRDLIASHEYQEELLEEQLPEFIEQLYRFTGAYIGELNYPPKQINLVEDTDENAHLDTTAPKLINYIGSSKSHRNLMLGKHLPLDKGVTAKVFELVTGKDGEEGQGNPEGGQTGQTGQADGTGDDAVDPNSVQQQKKEMCIYIPNVVKNQNVHYFRLPKLGAYIAVPLVYSSYLKEEIFDTALKAKRKQNDDRKDFALAKKEALQEIEKEKQQAGKQIAQVKEKNAEDPQLEALEEEFSKIEEKLKEKQAEQFVLEKVSLPVVKRQYVFCADNLGSDQEIPEQQRQFIIDLILHFKNSWEGKELQLLNRDVQTQLEYENKYMKEQSVEDLLAAIEAAQELDQQTKETIQAIQDENKRNYKIEGWKIEQLRKYFTENEKFINSFNVIKDFRVVKFRQLLQNILYFQGYKKEQINIKAQAGIDWKNVRKNLITKQLFQKVLAYVIQGPKQGEYPQYAKINSIISKCTNLLNLVQTIPLNEVMDYNIGLAVSMQYILRALKHRISNIELRKIQREEQKRKREQILSQNEKIAEDKKQALQTHKATLPAEEVESFSEEAWSEKYDEEHPLLEVPDEVVDDKDNDL